jgi:hypothetical protein
MAQSTKLPCPHCGSDAAGFSLMHSYSLSLPPGVRCFMQCGVCGEAIIAAYPNIDQVKVWVLGQQLVLPVGLKPTAIWPEARSDVTPESVPPNIASLYTQAMASLRAKHYDAAGPVFRRIMEVSLKTLHPEGEGSLYDRIENLPDDKGVTPAMKQWAHAVRLIGRDAAHDEDLVTKEEAEDMQAFVELFLVYAFDLPARIAARKTPHAAPT